MSGEYEKKEVRCPKLGHQVPFGYCRKENQGMPCPRALACWEPWPEVIASMKEGLSPKQWEQAFNRPPKPKLTTLVELIEEAKRAKKKS